MGTVVGELHEEPTRTKPEVAPAPGRAKPVQVLPAVRALARKTSGITAKLLLTRNPASPVNGPVGVEKRVGSLEAGKDGDLALYDGDPFAWTSHCVATIVEGHVLSEGSF